MPATAPRRAALEVMRAVRRGDLADRALDRASAGLDPRDHGWLLELAYGTLRLRGRLDHLLEALVRGGLDRLDPDVLDVLRLGAYQLLEMGSVPAYAAVSQSVDLARDAGAGRASGLVNGVLQALRRQQDHLRFPDPVREPVEYLSSWGSHPRWLVERWVDRWGAEETARLIQADNQRPSLYLRPLGLDAAEAVERLAAAGLQAERVALAPDSVLLDADVPVAAALAAVPAVVQDPAAALVVRYAQVPARGVVLDLCAAPGGKAAGLAERAERVVAADVSERRLRRLRENLERLEWTSRVGVVAADARRPPFRPAAAVLLDAPCTGTGTLRRHPDGRWRIAPPQLEELVALQRALMEQAAACVAAGGLLIYSTCSLEPEENEEQVRHFLDRRPEFVLDPPVDAVDERLLSPDGFLSVLPQQLGVDGSFAARLRRQD